MQHFHHISNLSIDLVEHSEHIFQNKVMLFYLYWNKLICGSVWGRWWCDSGKSFVKVFFRMSILSFWSCLLPVTLNLFWGPWFFKGQMLHATTQFSCFCSRSSMPPPHHYVLLTSHITGRGFYGWKCPFENCDSHGLPLSVFEWFPIDQITAPIDFLQSHVQQKFTMHIAYGFFPSLKTIPVHCASSLSKDCNTETLKFHILLINSFPFFLAGMFTTTINLLKKNLASVIPASRQEHILNSTQSLIKPKDPSFLSFRHGEWQKEKARHTTQKKRSTLKLSLLLLGLLWLIA